MGLLRVFLQECGHRPECLSPVRNSVFLLLGDFRGSEAARPGRRFKAVIGARIIADQVAHGPDPGFLKIQGRLRPDPPDYCYR